MHKDVTIKNIVFKEGAYIMKKAAALLVLTMTVAFAGCGSTPQADGTSAESNADLEAGTEVSEAQDSEGEDVLADGVLTVGTNAEFPPFEYVGDDGEPDGFDIALIRSEERRVGKECL